MTESIDKRISEIERELAGLRQQKLSELQSQVATLQASLGSSDSVVQAPARKGRPPKNSGWASQVTGSAAPAGKKRRGRKRGKHISDEEALANLKQAVKEAGKEGISARQASQTSGVFYPRAIKLMDENFKKSGKGKWTRYMV